MGTRIPVISKFVETEPERFDSKKSYGNGLKFNTEKLNELFLSELEDAW